MPNWCWNNLTIEGDKKSISKFKTILNAPDKIELVCKAIDKESLRKEYLEQEKDKQNHLDNILTFIESKTKPIDEFVLNEYSRLKYNSKIELNKDGDVVSIIKARMLNAFHPMPKELEGTTSPSPSDDVLIAQYGASNWYDWNCNSWGTKWDVDVQDNGYDSSEDEEYINLSFESAWSPPTAWLIKVAKDYPDLHFTLEYEEGGCAFKGVMEICEDQDKFSDKCWDWNGDCGECDTDYTEEGHCKCKDDNGKKLVWGEEVEDEGEEEDNPCAV